MEANEKLESLNRVYTKCAVSSAQRLIDALQKYVADPASFDRPYDFDFAYADFTRDRAVASATRLHAK